MLRETVKLHSNGTVILAKLQEDGTNKIMTPVGSAFLCHPRGYLLTCAHTFALTDSLGIVPVPHAEDFVELTRSEHHVLKVKVAQYDAINDVALLKLVDGEATVPQNLFADEPSVMIGSTCAHFGFPFADRGLHVRHISSAFVSAKIISKGGTRQFQFDGTAHNGGSGGPLVEVGTGKIIGIVSGRFAPGGGQMTISVSGYQVGGDSCISYATSIAYGIELMKAEGLDV